MRITDFRHHAPPQPQFRRAEDELQRLAEICVMGVGTIQDGQRHDQRHREERPNAFGNVPGAFIKRFCNPEQRKILQHLQSDHPLPFHPMFVEGGEPYFPGDPRKGRPTYGFGYHGWVTQSPTIWTFK
jgi:hypothetical protein